MESQDVLKIHGVLRRYCTSRVLNFSCIFYTSLDSMVYLHIILHLNLQYHLNWTFVRNPNIRQRHFCWFGLSGFNTINHVSIFSA